MDSSKRSTKGNAFFTGFGKFRRLVLFDTLIEKQTPEELVAILAHEIGHFEKKHIIRTMALSIIVSGIVFYTFSFFINNQPIFDAFQMHHLSTYASLVFIGFFYSPLFRILSIFSQMISRKHEFEADAFAVQTYGKPEVLISALKKLSVDNLTHLTPHPLKVALDYTHPPILERIRALRKM
jgi:STE24 endopeptidase